MAAITFKQLRAFVAVARLNRFRLAAEEIGLTQSAVSVLIKELEGQLGTTLFDRHTRLVGLTDSGARFLPLAQEIISQVDSALELMSDISNLRTGRVNIASAVVLASTYLPGKIKSFRDLHPEIKVNIRDVPEEDIRDLLLDRQVDIGIGSSRVTDAEINEKELFSDELAVFCRPDNPLTAKKLPLRWKDLAGQGFVALNIDNPLQHMIDGIFEKRNIKVEKLYEVQFATTLLALVEQGLGIGVLPANSQGLSGNSNISFLPVGNGIEPRKIVAFTLRERALSPAAKSFYRHLYLQEK